VPSSRRSPWRSLGWDLPLPLRVRLGPIAREGHTCAGLVARHLVREIVLGLHRLEPSAHARPKGRLCSRRRRAIVPPRRAKLRGHRQADEPMRVAGHLCLESKALACDGNGDGERQRHSGCHCVAPAQRGSVLRPPARRVVARCGPPARTMAEEQLIEDEHVHWARRRRGVDREIVSPRGRCHRTQKGPERLHAQHTRPSG